MSDDLTRLRTVLAPIAERARDLPWSDKRPWKPHTHVWLEGSLPVVDLHDLSVKLGRDAVRIVAETPELEAGAAALVTGRGNHTGGRSRLRDAVAGTLGALRQEQGLQSRPSGPGRFVLVLDEERYVAQSGGLGVWGWLLVALLGAALYATWPPLAAAWTLGMAVLWWRGRRR
jgi:hypothetical protein